MGFYRCPDNQCLLQKLPIAILIYIIYVITKNLLYLFLREFEFTGFLNSLYCSNRIIFCLLTR